MLMIQLLKATALVVDYDEDRRELLASGALASVVQPVLNRMSQKLAEEKPALVRDNDVVASTWLPPIPGGPFRRLVLSEAKIAIGRFVPQTVSIEVTQEGEYNPQRRLMASGGSELDTETIKGVIDQSLDLGACIITFTEGDPLLRDDILELVRYVDPQKAVVNLFTRGLNMTPEMALKLKEAGLHNLLVGIYSVDPEPHDALRGMVGSHQMAVEAIKIGLEAGLLVTMASHVKGGQISQISDLYDYAAELGVQEFSIWEDVAKRPEDQLTQIDRETIIRFYKKINKTPGGPRIFANTYFEGQMLGCMAGRRWLHVGVDGSVRPSPYVQETYGNVKDVSLKESWNRIRKSKKYDQFRSICPGQ